MLIKIVSEYKEFFMSTNVILVSGLIVVVFMIVIFGGIIFSSKRDSKILIKNICNLWKEINSSISEMEKNIS